MDEERTAELFENWTPPMPPIAETADGRPRRIGVELEMIELDVGTASRIVALHTGGEIEKTSRYEHVIHGADEGDWLVELDYEYLKERGREERPDDELMKLVDEATESVLRAGAEQIVPVEVVSPPLPLPKLAVVQSLIPKLRAAGAKGTGAGFSYAFGTQLNPELPDLEADTIAAYLKAFFCLYDWLAQRAAVDFTRRLTGFSASFPRGYVRKVVDTGYWPDQDALIDDYLADNPTRNRALDLLPLILHLDEERLRAAVDDPRVKPRPTLHYRLPNCEIHEPDWGIHLAWGDWLEVESLARDRDRLGETCARYTDWLDRPLSRLFDNWGDEIADALGLDDS